MGAESSAQRDGQSPEDAPASASASASAAAGELSAEVKALQDGKALQKNGQISSMSSLNGPSEDDTLAEVGQPDGVSVAQKEEAPEAADSIQGEVAPQLNGEKAEKEAPDANDIAVEEKAVEQKPDEAAEVGFKKIFRFVGFKFTLKKDKSEEKDPVKLLTVKDKEEEEAGGAEEPAQKEEEASTAEEKSTPEEKEAKAEAEAEESAAEVTKEESSDAPPEGAADGEAKDEGAEKEEASPPPAQEATVSTFRKLFSGGLFSNLRKKASVKKTKEEEEKESAVEEEAAKTEEAVEKEQKVEVEGETKEEAPETPKEEKAEAKEEVSVVAEEEKPGAKEEAPVSAGGEQPEPKEEAKPEAEPELTVEPPAAADETRPEEEKAEKEEKAAAEVASEGELQSSQEKSKPQGSPLKKLFTGAGLKKLSTKKHKNKKEAETKPAESGEAPAEHLQSSADSAEAPKAESGPSSPEESGEHAVAAEGAQNESGQETEGEAASDGEKKKEGIIAWSSFKKLVTPKKRVKRSSESEDEATGDRPAKSATLSSSESAEEETKEEKSTEEEPKTETTEKLVSSAEEPKKKMDTSVSWEALMCMGGAKKRARRTSDSDDDETEKEAPGADGEQEARPEAAAAAAPKESDGEAAAAEPSSSPTERESTWDTLKRMVMSKNRGRSEEKPEESPDQVQSDGEAPKDESSFSLRKLFPRKKKKAEKQSSADVGSGEEDSDTPAVVPLSEYDEQEEAPKEAPAEPAAAPSRAPAEERTPSWIPANVEDAEDKRDQLSDIPEEAENAATPKSVDTDVAEDESPEVARQRLPTAEVKALAQASAHETAPLPQGLEAETAEVLMEALHVQISQTPPETSVVTEHTPEETAAQQTEYEPPAENAESNTTAVLEPHVPDEAVAICTGLGSEEIPPVAQEEPATPAVESVTAVRDALSSEVAAEEKPEEAEEARAAEDAVHGAQVNQVEATHLEPVVENSQSEAPAAQVATQSLEPRMEASGVVTSAAEESVYVQPPAANENSPKAVIFDPIAPTAEALVCTQSVEVTEPTVETKEVEVEVEQRAATGERTAIREVVRVVTGPEIPVAAATEEACVIAETVVIAASQTTESEVSAAMASEKVEEMEARSVVIAQAVLQDAVEKVSADAREDKEPTAATPAPAQAVATTEERVEAESPVVMETPVVSLCQAPAPKAVQTLHVAMEVTDAVPIEVTEDLRAPDEEEEKKPEEPKELKQAVEVQVSEDAVVVEEVGETGDGEREEKERKVKVQEPDVKEEEEEVKEEKAEKEPEIHTPIQVVLQSAQVVEAPAVQEEAVVELDGSGPETKPSEEPPQASAPQASAPQASAPQALAPQASAPCRAEEAEAAPSGKCAEVMAQVIEVIEEAVKEIEPVSTEITAAS